MAKTVVIIASRKYKTRKSLRTAGFMELVVGLEPTTC